MNRPVRVICRMYMYEHHTRTCGCWARVRVAHRRAQVSTMLLWRSSTNHRYKLINLILPDIRDQEHSTPLVRMARRLPPGWWSSVISPRLACEILMPVSMAAWALPAEWHGQSRQQPCGWPRTREGQGRLGVLAPSTDHRPRSRQRPPQQPCQQPRGRQSLLPSVAP